MKTTAQDIIDYMESLHDEEQRLQLMRFFKTGKGDYGDGDEFLGLKVPQTREVVKHAKDLPLEEIPTLLVNRYHEVRLCGFLLLVYRFERQCTKKLINDKVAIEKRDEIVSMYLEYADYANNWDLVDLSAPKIIGRWLMVPTLLGDKQEIIDSLATSGSLWRERISMVCTWMTSRMGDPSWCLRYAEMHLHHQHDLMHKAVGWMLRELGKQVSMDLLRHFLQQHIHEMPRTALRYAIEKMSEEERKYWMNK
jgi:3-methyladenine DNA glycosylase AlkD